VISLNIWKEPEDDCNFRSWVYVVILKAVLWF